MYFASGIVWTPPASPIPVSTPYPPYSLQLDELQADGELPLADLLSRYGYVVDSAKDDGDDSDSNSGRGDTAVAGSGKDGGGDARGAGGMGTSENGVEERKMDTGSDTREKVEGRGVEGEREGDEKGRGGEEDGGESDDGERQRQRGKASLVVILSL